jgi:hypothetical protein
MLYSGSTPNLSYHSGPERDPDRLCFGSGSGLDPLLIRQVDPDPGRQKLPTKIVIFKKFHILKCWKKIFSCSLFVFYGDK